MCWHAVKLLLKAGARLEQEWKPDKAVASLFYLVLHPAISPSR